MSATYIIETRNGAAGIVVRDGRGFRFFAATHEFSGLDGRLFATPRAAEAAAFDHLYGVNGRSRPRRSGNSRSPLTRAEGQGHESSRAFSPSASTTDPFMNPASVGPRPVPVPERPRTASGPATAVASNRTPDATAGEPE